MGNLTLHAMMLSFLERCQRGRLRQYVTFDEVRQALRGYSLPDHLDQRT